MIDIHTHILPACDDGAQDSESALRELGKMIASGVTDVITTPHFFLESGSSEREKITTIYREFEKQIKKENLNIRIHLLAEIYLYPEIFRENMSLPCISKQKYILVETSATTSKDEFCEYGYKLLNDGFRPILAHPERYKLFNRFPQFAEDLIFRNFYLQVNAGSLLGVYGKGVEKTAWYIIKNRYAHFIASDTHCSGHEYYLPAAYDKITSVTGKEYADKLVNDNPAKLLNGEKIDYHNSYDLSSNSKSLLVKALAFIRRK